MPLDAGAFKLTLTETELSDLLSVNANSPQQKQLQEQLREQTADGGREISLNDMQLGRLIRAMTQGPTAVQHVLKRTFQRPLMELLSK